MGTSSSHRVSRRRAPAAAPTSPASRPTRALPPRPAVPPEGNGAARGTESGVGHDPGSAEVNGQGRGAGGGAGHRGPNGAGDPGRGTGSAAVDGAARSEAAQDGSPAKAETIEECLLRSLEQYFADLDGAKPHALHDMVMQAVERPLLRFALMRAAGNQSAAAELLGINRNTLRKKMLDYRLV